MGLGASAQKRHGLLVSQRLEGIRQHLDQAMMGRKA
jgi:hypothetical protein